MSERLSNAYPPRLRLIRIIDQVKNEQTIWRVKEFWQLGKMIFDSGEESDGELYRLYGQLCHEAPRRLSVDHLLFADQMLTAHISNNSWSSDDAQLEYYKSSLDQVELRGNLWEIQEAAQQAKKLKLEMSSWNRADNVFNRLYARVLINITDNSIQDIPMMESCQDFMENLQLGDNWNLRKGYLHLLQRNFYEANACFQRCEDIFPLYSKVGRILVAHESHCWPEVLKIWLELTTSSLFHSIDALVASLMQVCVLNAAFNTGNVAIKELDTALKRLRDVKARKPELRLPCRCIWLLLLASIQKRLEQVCLDFAQAWRTNATPYCSRSNYASVIPDAFQNHEASAFSIDTSNTLGLYSLNLQSSCPDLLPQTEMQVRRWVPDEQSLVVD